jgi:anoctamin-10/anoctamin-7
VKARISKAIALRKQANDPFRNLNGYSWDYVMVFKVYKSTEKLTLKQSDSTLSIKGIVERLSQSGLETKLFFSVQNDEVYCKIRSSLKRLLQEADRIGYIMRLDSAGVPNALIKGKRNMSEGPPDYIWKPVSIPARSTETEIPPYDYIYGKFSSQVHENSPIYTTYSNNTLLRGTDRVKLICSIIAARIEDSGCQLDTTKLVHENCLLGVFPLHDLVELRSLEEKWMKVCQAPWQQDVEAVKDYFGEKVALYFTWLGHYTSWLMLAASVGVFFWFFVAAKNNDPYVPTTFAFEYILIFFDNSETVP